MEPPVPIPNTVVKHLEAESTCMETCWEDRKLPVKKALNNSVLFSYIFLEMKIYKYTNIDTR